MQSVECIIIAIDGPAGSGKSTLARGLSRALKIGYLNSGAIYRALALKALREKVDPSDDIGAARLAKSALIEFGTASDDDEEPRLFLDGEDVTAQLWTNEVSTAASAISRHAVVRRELVRLQRKIVEGLCDKPAQGNGLGNGKAVVIEGRDIGTVVFPDADVKIYLDANLEERARRRLSDFNLEKINLPTAIEEILARDISDINRSVGPLKSAPDAIVIDNTNWPKEKTLQHAISVIRKKLDLPLPDSD